MNNFGQSLKNKLQHFFSLYLNPWPSSPIKYFIKPLYNLTVKMEIHSQRDHASYGFLYSPFLFHFH